ncbi:hypothetical protein ACIRPH_06690 [Nocardiopsis sp. NPDC101807]|uniref:hypothetical protein n=1 Tax=Nocardiopsis sp. NPDC101807 TaxID=3364339 RepID=UPI003814106D
MNEFASDYALLALRLARLLDKHHPGTWILDYRGPARWREQVAAEPEPLAEEVVVAADALAAEAASWEGPRAAWMREQVGALAAAARRLTGKTGALRERVRGGLGLEVGWIAEERFEEAYELLDRGLPRSGGTLRERLVGWRAAHSIVPARSPHFSAMVRAAITESIERTRALVELPPQVRVDCELAPGPFRGLHRGGSRGTVLVDGDLPFNTADLLYVVTHEAFPGHIAEFMLKEALLSDHPELGVRFMPAPSYVLSEGLGLHAQQIVFPRDEAQKWLVDNIEGFTHDGSDHADIHRARNILWGSWCNAALLADEGGSPSRVRAYLAEHALLDDDELSVAPDFLGEYIFAYYHGWRLLEHRVQDPAFVRRLLTEQVSLGEVLQEEGDALSEARPGAVVPEQRERLL